MHWILAHLIGDFLLQNDWLAQNKKKSSLACTVHVALYIVPFLFCDLAWWQLLAIAGQHWIQDRTNLVVWVTKLRGADGFLQPPFAPWSTILTDQIFHILWMAAITSIPGHM